MMQVAQSKLLMHAALFTSTHKRAANNAYNCSNGTRAYFRTHHTAEWTVWRTFVSVPCRTFITCSVDVQCCSLGAGGITVNTLFVF